MLLGRCYYLAAEDKRLLGSVKSIDELLERSTAFLAAARSMLPLLEPWLPRVQMRAVRSFQQQREASLAAVKQGKLWCAAARVCYWWLRTTHG